MNKFSILHKGVALLLIILLSIVFTIPAYATEPVITCSSMVEGDLVTINGKISNITSPKQVTLLVEDGDRIIALNQTASDESGKFSFRFRVPPGLEYSDYSLKVGSDSGAQVYNGTVVYSAPPVKTKFLDGNINININSYVPSISGTLASLDGTLTEFIVTNTTDNIIIAKETILPQDGEFTLNYTLPSLLYPKEYSVLFSCYDGNRVLSSISAVISSSTILVSGEGTVDVTDGVSVDMNAQSIGTDIFNKSTTITQDKTVSATLPNILAGGSFSVTIQGYEDRTNTETLSAYYQLSGNSNNIVRLIAKADNFRNFNGKYFTLEYNPQEITPISLFGAEAVDYVGLGTKGKVTVQSHESGKIVFSVNELIPNKGYSLNGVLNVFKFKFNSDFSGDTLIKLY